jgi:hypothetical protein
MIATNQANTQQMIIQMVDANKEQMQAAIKLGETMATILTSIGESLPSTPKRMKKGVRLSKQKPTTPFKFTPNTQATLDGILNHRPHQQQLQLPQGPTQEEIVEL